MRLVKDTVWLSLNQMADLFERDKSVISRHLHNVFKDNELIRNSVVANFATTAVDGKTYQVEYFNLDAELLETAERKADTEPVEVPAGGEARDGFSSRRTRPVFGEVTFTQFRTPAN